MYHMMAFILMSDAEVCAALAARAKAIRLANNWPQSEFAARAGLSTPTIQRFERGEMISLGNFVRIVTALRRASDLERLLLPDEPLSIAELESRLDAPVRRRARKPRA